MKKKLEKEKTGCECTAYVARRLLLLNVVSIY